MLITQTGPLSFIVSHSNESVDLVFEQSSPNTLILRDGHHQHSLRYFMHNDKVTLFSDTGSELFDIIQGYSLEEVESGAGSEIVSPMPGVVKVVNTSAKSEVASGDVLVIIEAMKMEHSLVVSRDGVVSNVLIQVGQQVEAGEVLLLLEGGDD